MAWSSTGKHLKSIAYERIEGAFVVLLNGRMVPILTEHEFEDFAVLYSVLRLSQAAV